jgi:hypothetical protein
VRILCAQGAQNRLKQAILAGWTPLAQETKKRRKPIETKDFRRFQ